MGTRGEGEGLSSHVGAAGDEDGFQRLGRGYCVELFEDLKGEFSAHIS